MAFSFEIIVWKIWSIHYRFADEVVSLPVRFWFTSDFVSSGFYCFSFWQHQNHFHQSSLWKKIIVKTAHQSSKLTPVEVHFFAKKVPQKGIESRIKNSYGRSLRVCFYLFSFSIFYGVCSKVKWTHTSCCSAISKGLKFHQLYFLCCRTFSLPLEIRVVPKSKQWWSWGKSK